jgi:hypothetical protein
MERDLYRWGPARKPSSQGRDKGCSAKALFEEPRLKVQKPLARDG